MSHFARQALPERHQPLKPISWPTRRMRDYSDPVMAQRVPSQASHVRPTSSDVKRASPMQGQTYTHQSSKNGVHSTIGAPPSVGVSPASSSLPNLPESPYAPLNHLAIPLHLIPGSAADDIFASWKLPAIDPESPPSLRSPRLSASIDLKSLDLEFEDDPEILAMQVGKKNPDHSPERQWLEDELEKLSVNPTTGSQSAATHKARDIARGDGAELDQADTQAAVTEWLQEISDAHTGNSNPKPRNLPPLPRDRHEERLPQPISPVASPEASGPPPWQRIHQRLLDWTILWTLSQLESALDSTMRGHQVNELTLSICCTQAYKRHVRMRTVDTHERIERLFVPPNVAAAINTAVYNGRHSDAAQMLRDMWEPFGLEGIPRLLLVLAKQLNDDNHWVVHRYSLPDGSLRTYDTHLEKSLPDSKPLRWWYAIRIAWPDDNRPSPDHLKQRMVFLHCPLQLPTDNSVAAFGIWRNLLMSFRAARDLDLHGLRDLMNKEVMDLRQRKILGKLLAVPTLPE